jgi:carboxyl-terminal processing protease
MAVRNLLWMATLVAVALMFIFIAPRAARQDTLYRGYRELLEADALVRRHFIEDMDRDALAEGAVRGLLDSLDPFSCYLNPDELADYRLRLSGEHVGIGAAIGLASGVPVVIAPVEGGAAMAAGVRAGDVILAVDGRSTENMSAFEVEGLLAGPAGSVVEITYRAAGGEADAVTQFVTRQSTADVSVKGVVREGDGWAWMLLPDEGIGYVRVAEFHDQTAAQFDRALRDMREAGLKGLILDLRFNPGGVVPQAVAVADRFIADGLLLTTITKVAAEERYRATSTGTDTTTPLVVLVNGSTASAAEIVAGVLQDRERAAIVGSRSFGKGSVQYILELAGGKSAIRLTSAYYQLPSGRFIHKTPASEASGAWGVRPDVLVELSPDEERRLVENRVQVDGGAGGQEETSQAATLEVDRQLRAAVDHLREVLSGKRTR